MPNTLSQFHDLTEVDAVNTLLAIIGEQPVNSINSELTEAGMALNALYEVNLELQSQGWQFNTDYKLTLVPDPLTKQIPVSPSSLFVDLNDFHKSNYKYDVTVRGYKLYDKQRHSYEFDEPLDVDITFYMPWDSTPILYRRYCVIRAGRMFASRILGSQEVVGYTERDEAYARAAWLSVEAKQADYNYLAGDRQNNLMRSFRPSDVLMRNYGRGY